MNPSCSIIIYPTGNSQSHRTIPTTWPSNILQYCTVFIGRLLLCSCVQLTSHVKSTIKAMSEKSIRMRFWFISFDRLQTEYERKDTNYYKQYNYLRPSNIVY